MLVSAVMCRDVSTCEVADGLDAAVGQMEARDCGIVPIIDGAGRLVGVITDRDAAIAALHCGRPLHEVPVGDAMTRDPVTVRPADPVALAETLMREHQVRRLPVVDEGGRLVGILSVADLARALPQPEALPWVRPLELARTMRALSAPPLPEPRRQAV